MSHVTQMNESCHTYDWVESQIWIQAATSYMCATWLIHTCDMAHPHVRQDSCICNAPPIHMCAFSHIHTHVNVCLWRCAVSQAYMRHEWWLIYMCALSQAHMRHDSLICATRLIDMYNTTYWYVRQDSFICAIKLIQMCDTTHSYVWHDSFVCATWFNHVRDMT